MKLGLTRKFIALNNLCQFVSKFLANIAHVSKKALVPLLIILTIPVPFIILILAGFTLMIYNGIAIRKKAFVKDDVVQPIMQELQNLNVEGAMAL